MRRKICLVSGFAILAFSFYTVALSQEGLVQTKSFAVTRGGLLEMSIRGGDITISPWEKNEVFIEVSGIDEDDLDDLTMTQAGNTVSISFLPRWGSNARFDINTPSQFNTDMKTSGGDIRFTGPMNGKLIGSTSGGDIRLRDVVGSVEMKTSGGDIMAGNVTGDLYVNTSGGDIKLGLISGRAEVKTSGGDIRIDDVGKNLNASTSGGNVSVGNSGGEVTISTAGGDLMVGRVSGGASLRTAGGDIILRSAAGAVKAHTAGGDIRLDSISGYVDAKTSAGNIYAELAPGGGGKSRLSSSVGNVVLYVQENIKATIIAQLRVRGKWYGYDESNIYSDFPTSSFEKDDRGREIRATYNLNGGGDPITIDVSMGNIEIRKAGTRSNRGTREYRYEKDQRKQKDKNR